MPQKYVMIFDLVKYRNIRIHILWIFRLIFLFLQMIKAGNTVQLHKEGQIQRTVDRINIAVFYIQLLFKYGKQPFIDAGFTLKPYGNTTLPFLQLSFYFDQKILSLIFVYRKISITHYSEGMSAYDII